MGQQLKKILYNKRLVDNPTGGMIAEWKISPWKVFFLLISIAIVLTIVYAYFFTENPADFLGNLLFYSIVLLVIIAVLWITANTALNAKKRIQGFLIAFILILVLYWFLHLILGHFNILEIHMEGIALWLVISVLAFIGAKRIDGSLDRNDIGYGLLVFLILLGANLPIANGHGFLWNVDNLIATIMGYIPWG